MSSNALPIWNIHDEIVETLGSTGRLVLVAPTGSGKSTQVPQMILDADLAGGKRIVVLEPRRVAARTLAARVASERKGRLGGEIGYRIRFDDVSSRDTRVSFVTEGVLLRQLQDDPTLADVGAVVFDEFHERNLMSDVALAMVKQLQRTRRPDLKLAVMSATLDAEPVGEYLDARILTAEGSMFPVTVFYTELHDDRRPAEKAAAMVARIINADDPGDILVFMPGMGEIQQTLNELRAIRTDERFVCLPLYGELSIEQQDLAFAPNALRKVIVATNVAETSVTIDGIQHVVDSGLARIARYDAERGMSTLFVEDISRASADQRKGRAGRTAPGTCRRLWSESNHLNRPERNTPEIQRADLAETVLFLHSQGVRKAGEFDWLDKPDHAAVERAEELLRMLGAIRATDDEGEGGDDLTDVGRSMLRLPMHPRYARMLVEAAKYDCVPGAALCAALVSGRDLLLRANRDDRRMQESRESLAEGAESDFEVRMRAFVYARNKGFDLGACKAMGVHAQVAREVERTHRQIMDIVKAHGLNTEGAVSPSLEKDEGLRRSIVAGFVDQLGMRRDKGTLECVLTGGRTGTLMRECVIAREDGPELFVTADAREVSTRGPKSITLLGLATAVKIEWLKEMFPQHFDRSLEHVYDRSLKRVEAFEISRFLDLTLAEKRTSEREPVACGRALAKAARADLLTLPEFSHEVQQFIARVNLVDAVLPELEFPAFDEIAIENCLARALRGVDIGKRAQEVSLRAAFRKRLKPEQNEWLDELAPTRIPWLDEKSKKLLYAEAARDKKGAIQAPELQIKINECFRLEGEHPTICEGKLKPLFRLQWPNGKKLAETDDWPIFRKREYPKLRKEMQAKFPAVNWP
jgi:ATP-dependent helicase HrpB